MPKYGITEIVIPGHHKLESTTKTESWTKGSIEQTGAAFSLSSDEIDSYVDLGFIPQKTIDEHTDDGELDLIDAPAFSQTYPEGSWRIKPFQQPKIRTAVRGSRNQPRWYYSMHPPSSMADKPWHSMLRCSERR